MIDIVIPCIESDLGILKNCINGAISNVEDEIGKIFVVSPNSNSIKSFCNERNVSFIDEMDLLGFNKNDLNLGNRSGWLYQQIIKLASDKFGDAENYLVLDADHVLLKPHKFIDCENTSIFYVSDEYHAPYFNALNKLFNGKYQKILNKSFISDKMVFNKKVLSNMKDEIEKTHKINWIEAIKKCYDYLSFCGFSEYETYGNYYLSNGNKSRIIDDGRFMCFEKKIENMTLEELKEEYKEYKSITEYKLAK